MINVLPESQTETIGLFERSDIGLFEINDAGTILYCRTGSGGISHKDSSSDVGRNFFYEVAPFENMEELRRRFNSFVNSRSTTANFTFSCLVKNTIIPARILLVRIVERSNSERDKTTIVDIRKI
jgi:hypothetical protein